MAATAITVFGSLQQVAYRIKKFDWSKVDVKDSTRDDNLHLHLAPSFGELTPNSVKDLDENLKIITAGTMRTRPRPPPL
ncbi:hypothetical protein B0H12DRAFT_1246098 [Mycena haematopus]|nr:hypothetical protein B0H12DRAFT_1246098 [Mycena haematopus]